MNVVSFSGGKDSTAMLLMMIERGEPIDKVIFFDSGWEFPEMYDHVAMVELATGVEIERVHPEKSFDHLMFEHELRRGKRAGEHGYGWPRPNARWCTTYKNRAISKAITGLGGGRSMCRHSCGRAKARQGQEVPAGGVGRHRG